jgi:hypothetical protein
MFASLLRIAPVSRAINADSRRMQRSMKLPPLARVAGVSAGPGFVSLPAVGMWTITPLACQIVPPFPSMRHFPCSVGSAFSLLR